MHPKAQWTLLILIALAAIVFIAGCSGPDNGANATPAAGSVAPTTAGPLYSAGDVVKNPKTSSPTALLIIGYDSTSDMYERALIYPNADGSWGYRMNADTVKAPRSVIEKVYTEKLTTVTVSAVPTGMPTPVPTTVEVTTAAPTTTATTAAAPKPVIRDIMPDSGMVGTSVSVTDLHGSNFVSGATVSLTKDGSTTIVATNVVISSPTDLTCIFAIPSGATPGSWNLVVANPDGQSVSYSNLFDIHYNPSATTTTSSTGGGGITITNIDPKFSISGQYPAISVTGSNFQNGIVATLTLSGKTITAVDCLNMDVGRDQMTCHFLIPTGSQGSWTFNLINTDGTTGTYSIPFSING